MREQDLRITIEMGPDEYELDLILYMARAEPDVGYPHDYVDSWSVENKADYDLLISRYGQDIVDSKINAALEYSF